MTLKELLRGPLETRGGTKVRNFLAWQDLERESLFVENVARKFGAEALDFKSAQARFPNAKSGRLFILGSGASVLELDESNFSEIREHSSLGINGWLLHDFVPDCFSYEPLTHRNTGHFGTLRLLSQKMSLTRGPSIFFLKPRNQFEGDQLGHIPRELQTNTYLYGRSSPFTRRVENLGAELETIFLRHKDSRLRNAVLDSGASIFRMSYLGLLMGFREIVYVGVDLLSPDYFWEKDPSFISRRGLGSFDAPQPGLVHETLDPKNRPFIVSDALRALSVVMDRRFGARFFTANSASPLADFMPSYDWHS